jgi:hypothetical protein
VYEVNGFVMKNEGNPDRMRAYFMGYMLGNRAVRLATDEPGTYEQACKNYERVRDLETEKLRDMGNRVVQRRLRAPWDSQQVLKHVYPTDVVAALMDITSAYSRDSAAVVIGTFCLSELPDLTSEGLMVVGEVDEEAYTRG